MPPWRARALSGSVDPVARHLVEVKAGFDAARPAALSARPRDGVGVTPTCCAWLRAGLRDMVSLVGPSVAPYRGKIGIGGRSGRCSHAIAAESGQNSRFSAFSKAISGPML